MRASWLRLLRESCYRREQQASSKNLVGLKNVQSCTLYELQCQTLLLNSTATFDLISIAEAMN